MKKGIIIVVLAVLALAAVIFFDTRTSKSGQEGVVPEREASAAAPAATQAAGNDIPAMPLMLLDGSQVMTKDLEGKTILVVYQPTCDHCQREATAIRENIAAFKEYQLYFISDAGLPEQREFADTYKLADQRNVHFGYATTNDVLDQFGSIQTPSMFVFSDEGRLVKSFIGETPVQEIIQGL